MSEIALLHALVDREDYDRYIKYIKPHTLTDITQTLLKDMQVFLDKFSEVEVIDWDEFSSWFKMSAHPAWKPEKMDVYTVVLDKLEDYAGGEVVSDIINKFIELDYSTKILDVASHLVDQDGKHSIQDVLEICEQYEKCTDVAAEESVGEVHLGLSALLDKTVSGEGYDWKLPDLNASLGSVRLGDMVGIVARPEVGKTTLAMDEATYLISQMEEASCLVCNNEESSEKLQLRSYQAVLAQNSLEILKDVSKSEAAYKKFLNGNRFIVWKPANGSMSKRAVEQKIKQHDPKVVVFNVLDKVHGFNSQNEVQAGRERAQWAREIASQGRIVLVLLQADATAEGNPWMDQSQIYGSKTGVQGETDALIMIGKKNDPACVDLRYVNITRNKLVGGGPIWNPAHQYLKSEIKFDTHRAQYTTSRFKT